MAESFTEHYAQKLEEMRVQALQKRMELMDKARAAQQYLQEQDELDEPSTPPEAFGPTGVPAAPSGEASQMPQPSGAPQAFGPPPEPPAATGEAGAPQAFGPPPRPPAASGEASQVPETQPPQPDHGGASATDASVVQRCRN